MDEQTYNNVYMGVKTEYSYENRDGRDFMAIAQNGNIVYLQMDQISRLAEKGEEWLVKWKSNELQKF